jgi:hypothetical protein
MLASRAKLITIPIGVELDPLKTFFITAMIMLDENGTVYDVSVMDGVSGRRLNMHPLPAGDWLASLESRGLPLLTGIVDDDSVMEFLQSIMNYKKGPVESIPAIIDVDCMVEGSCIHSQDYEPTDLPLEPKTSIHLYYTDETGLVEIAAKGKTDRVLAIIMATNDYGDIVGFGLRHFGSVYHSLIYEDVAFEYKKMLAEHIGVTDHIRPLELLSEILSGVDNMYCVGALALSHTKAEMVLQNVLDDIARMLMPPNTHI